MGIRHERLEFRKAKAIKIRRRNAPVKAAERLRRETAMLARLRRSQPPYTPAMLSWLSRKLDKPASQITPKDIKALLA